MSTAGIRAIYVGVCVAIAAAVIYFVSAAGYSFWLGIVAAFVVLFLVNGSLAYRFRARQLRLQGQEPPPFLLYLFYPKPISFSERVPLARPFRALLGIVILIGGAFLVLTGTVILLNLDFAKLPHPLGAAIATIVLASIGVGIAYVGIRLMVVKDDEPMFGRRKSRETKASDIAA